jgi:hypothetical protein
VKVPSRAGHFIFRAETKLTILTICMSKNHKFFQLIFSSSFYDQKFLSKKATWKCVVFLNQVGVEHYDLGT